MDRVKLVDKANTLIGCLHSLQTTSGRRRDSKRDGKTLDVPNPFIIDEGKLLGSKAFRLLEWKTQVVTTPGNPFLRNRKTHVLEVVSCSVMTANILGLNVGLARAIAIGHDIGHVPFGHPGEDFLRKAMDRPEFCHEVMGPIIAQKIERRGNGLDLTHETLTGMMCHSGARARAGMTPEAWAVRFCDKIAYIFADYNDLIVRMKFPARLELRQLMDEFGENQRERTTTAMAGLIVESAESRKVVFDQSEVAEKFKQLREFMYEIYPRIIIQDPEPMMGPVLRFLENLKICDPYLMLALMTDKDVAFLARQPAIDFSHIQQTPLAEFLPRIEHIAPPDRPIDMCNPYLDW